MKEENIQFFSLNPKDNVKDIEIYETALDYAINNEDINNIAITGKFGSGKTSIINTYKNKHPEKKFFSISLATFKDKLDDRDSIERSILQQLFYRTSNKNIPYSRFKRISNISRKDIIKRILTICITIILLIGAGYLLFHPNLITCDEINKLLNDVYNKYFSSFRKGIASTILIFLFLGSISYIVYKVIEYIITKIKLSPKLNLKNENIELEVKSENQLTNEQTIFNKYLDEIMYFFEATDYDVIVIEDLDRFKGQADGIFVKLREICNMINESEDIKRRIKFIYAIQDDIFKNDERTKFFDFIIPVIPILDANNAEGIIKNRIEDLKINCEQNFISNISYFIKDMRTFNNISNEFLIYKDRLNYNRKEKEIKALEDKKLLAMIVYKNLNSEEFAKIQDRKGNLFNVFNNKNLNILRVIQETRNRIKDIDKSLEKSKSEILCDIEEFKKLMITKISELTGESTRQIRINGTPYDKEKILSENFDIHVLEDARLYNGHNFKEIMPKEELKMRISNVELKNENNINLILKQKKEMLEKIAQIKSLNMKDLIDEYGISNFFTEEERKDELLVMLICNGYIDESYSEYINYFYPGILSIEDKEFLINVQAYGEPWYSYNLLNPKIVIDRIEENKFYNCAVLNYNLVDNLLTLNEEEKLEKIHRQLKNNSEETKLFLENYINITNQIEKFILFITNDWTEIWIWLEQNLSADSQLIYLYYIIKYASIEVIKQINMNDKFKRSIEKQKDFIEHFITKEEIEKAKQVIIELEVKFDKLERNDIRQELGNFIIDNNLYKINYETIKDILIEKFNVNTDDCNNMNFTSIVNTDKKTKDNVLKHAEAYIENVLMHDTVKIKDKEDDILQLLNHPEIEMSLKVKIIEKQEVIIGDISNVSKELWDYLLNNNKVECNWKNIFLYYNNKGKTKEGIEFININVEKIIELQKNEVEENHKIICDLIVDSNINDIFIDLIPDNSIDGDIVEKIESKNRIKKTIGKIKISIDNYDKIRENNYDLLPEYISKDIQFFKNRQRDLEYDSFDFDNILDSAKIKNEDKLELIENVKEDIECKNEKSALIYFNLLTSNKNVFSINPKLLIGIIDNLTDTDKKIELLSIYLKFIAEDKIVEILEKIEEPYCNILGNRIPRISKGIINDNFIKAMKEKNLSWLATIKEDKKDWIIYKRKKKN